jgi:hypothetical protein
MTVDTMAADIGANLKRYRGARTAESRWASFDYCFNYFQEARQDGDTKRLNDDENRQLSCLQIGFYLASWGMMRGSGQLLQNSVRGLAPVVKQIAEVSASTWELDVHLYADHADEVVDLGWRIRDGFSESNVHASDTLVTKTMLGVFGCVPAFDRYFRIGSGLRLFSEKSLRSIGSFCEDNQAVIDAAQVPTLDFLTGDDTERNYPRAQDHRCGVLPRRLQPELTNAAPCSISSHRG